MNSAPSKEPNMLSMVRLEKSKRECPDLWLCLAAEDYVTTRVLIYLGLDRLGAYHMQQAVEKYLKAFIMKKCNGEGIKYKTHNLRILLEQCQKKDVFFNEERVKMLIDILFKDLDWDKIPGEDEEKFREFLYQTYDISIEKSAKIDKIDDDKEIKVVSINNQRISLKLNKKPDDAKKAVLTINDHTLVIA